MTTLKEILESKIAPWVKNVNEEGDEVVGYRLENGYMLASLFDDTTTLYDPQGNIVEQWLSNTGDEYHPKGGYYYDLPVHNNTCEGGIPIKNICVKHPKHCEECKDGYCYQGCDEPGCYNLNCFEHNICEDCENRGNMCCCCLDCGNLQSKCECRPCSWCDTVGCEDPEQCYYYGEKCTTCGRQATCWECECEKPDR